MTVIIITGRAALGPCEKSEMKTFAIRIFGRQKEKFMQVSCAKRTAIIQLEIKERMTQLCVSVL
jgi:hypothetical protein